MAAANLSFKLFDAIDGEIIKIAYNNASFNSDYFNHHFHKNTKFISTSDYALSYEIWSVPENGLLEVTDANHTLRFAEIACWQSHLQLLFRISDDENSKPIYNPPVLILEDDVQISSNLALIVQNLLKTIPKDWEILFLGFPKRIRGPIVSDSFRRVVNTFNAHAYLIRDAAAARK